MAFVVSDGALTGVSRPAPSSARSVSSVRLADDYTADYAEIWRTQPAVRMVVDFLGRNIASIPLHQYQRVTDTDRKRLTDDPLARVIRSPGYGWTSYRLFDAAVHDRCIFDNAYWVKMQADGRFGLLRLPPQWVSPQGGTWIRPDFWRVRGGRGYLDIPVDRVVHFRGFSAGDARMGSSPIEALRRTLAEEYAAGQMREQTLRNGARVSGYLSRPTSNGDWTVPSKPGGTSGFDRFRAMWQEQYSGSGSRAGGTPILEDGMTFVPASMNPDELQYIESRRLSREEVATQYFIPPPMVGILEHATFSNITQQHQMLYQDTLGPWLEEFQQEIELQLLPEVAKAPRSYVEFNLADKLKGSFSERVSAISKAVGGPYMTRNEGRALENLPSHPDGDELIVPKNVSEGGQASPADSVPDDREPAAAALYVPPRPAAA